MKTLIGTFGAIVPTSPSFRVRTRIPSAELCRYGIAMRHEPLLSEEEDRRFHSGGAAARARTLLAARSRLARLLEARADWDVSLVQRQVDLMPSLRLERLSAQGKRVVLDIDDAIWHDRSPAAGGIRWPGSRALPGRFAGWLNAPRRSSRATICSRSGYAPTRET